MSKTKPSKEGQLILDRFKVKKKIGAGAFGDIYFAEDVQSGNKCAIKFEPLNSKFFQLPTEYRAYQAVANEIGFPRCIAYDRTATDLILAMDLLSKNLKELFELCGKSFSVKTVLYIAIQTVTRIETLHRKNYVYRDIKPENFMIGLPGTEGGRLIHLIDFGMVKQYIDPATEKHIPMREGKPVTGTTRYMSTNGHFNYELSRRDDLESLGYMFLFFLKGSLPWSGNATHEINSNPVEQCRRIGSMKQALLAEDLFEGFPSAFANYLNYVRNLQFEETPDYDKLRQGFHSTFGQCNLVDDGVFDWDNLVSS